jgi:hypothetical protein
VLFVVKQLGWRLVINSLAQIVAGVFGLILIALGAVTSASSATMAAWGIVVLMVWVVTYLLMFEWLEDAGRVRSIGDMYRRIRTGLWPR